MPSPFFGQVSQFGPGAVNSNRLARAWLSLLGLGLCDCGPGGAAPREGGVAGRDWQQDPAVFTLTGTKEIDVLGDLHGDPSVTERVLIAAGLITDTAPYSWAGGSKVLVVTGDVIDKGAAATPIIDLLIALAPEARVAGGRVVVTLGNHEAEFVADPTQDKSTEFRDELSSLGIDPIAVASGQTKYGAWLATRPVAALVDGWFFAHAGNSQGMSAGEIAASFQQRFDPQGVPSFDDALLLGSDSLLEAESWWAGGKTSAIDTLDADLAALPATHIVFGHDPGEIDFPDDPAGNRAPGEMATRYGGRIFLIDVGMSYAVGYSNGSLLQILRGPPDAANQIMPDGTSRPLWP
jgi:hypothetical protein